MRKNITIKKISAWFILLLICMLFGTTSDVATYISILLSVLCASVIAESFTKCPSVGVPKGIVVMLVLQNFIIGVGAHAAGNSGNGLKFLTQIPFLSIAVIWAMLQLKMKKLHRNRNLPQRWFHLLLCCIALSALIGRGSVQAILVNIRNLTVFFMAFEIGQYSLQNASSFHEFERFLLKIGLIVLVVGIIILISGYPLYKAIGIKEVYIAKNAPILKDALDDRFHTTLYKTEYTRMGSLYYEPVNLAYLYAEIFLVAWFGGWTHSVSRRVFYILISGVGLVLTFGKGGYMIVGAVFLCIYGQKLYRFLMRRLSKKTVKKLTISTLIVVLTAFCIFYYIYVGAAARPHFEGIIRTWASVLRKPIGYGLGTGGNAAQSFGAKMDWLSSGGETALMSFMYQLGIQGVLVFAICLTSTHIDFKNNDFRMIMYCYLPFILLGISLLQDNTYTPQCIVPFMLLQGGAKKINV